MIVGYTGTQKGMTTAQRFAVVWVLARGEALPNFAEHGDCIGGDEEFHALCEDLGIPVGVRPCTVKAKRAFCKPSSGWVAPPMPPLHRNKQTVKSVDFLIATPAQDYEYPRSGTWATVRYARERSERDREFAYIVIGPGGNVLENGGFIL